MERQRPFQKLEGEYLLETRRRVRVEGEEQTVETEVGKCSVAWVERDLRREEIRSESSDSGV